MTIADVPQTAAATPFPAPPQTAEPVHPLGGRATVLLCSVFGPYARDDEHGSRAINPMELWHNQVTRVQGPFSLRMFHRSWGLMLIQANLEARCTCLDFPTLERFEQELRERPYDVIGISAILPNFRKVRTMCERIRRLQPKATIVIGGHIAGLADLGGRIDADHVVRGDGIRWFRRFLGEDVDRPIRHPQIWAGIQRRTLGVALPFNPRTASATLIPSVGCPMGCNFCATSAMFGGKGHVIDFFPLAEDLFAVMSQLEEAMGVRSFFVMDENFLLNRPRAMALLKLMQRHGKPWALYVFSSANALRQYTMEELVALGVSWVWLGLEGKDSRYGKLSGTDTRRLVRQLQQHGIRVQGSTIIGLEEHTPQNIDEAIAYAVEHDADFHQFMLYTPVAGTPLHAEHAAAGTLLTDEELPFEDVHGQYRFNYRHPHIRDGQETEYLLRAFEEDYRVNGPSVLRVVRTTLEGWRRYRHHPDARIRGRIAWEAAGMRTVFPGALWAARRWFRQNEPLARRLDALLREVCREFGLLARLTAPLVGRVLLRRIAREDRLLRAGRTWEPPTFYERNYQEAGDSASATLLRSVPGREGQAAPCAR